MEELRPTIRQLKKTKSLTPDNLRIVEYFLQGKDEDKINPMKSGGQKIRRCTVVRFAHMCEKTFLSIFIGLYGLVIHRLNHSCTGLTFKLFHLKTYRVIAMVKAVMSGLVLIKIRAIHVDRLKKQLLSHLYWAKKPLTNAYGKRMLGSG